MPVAEQRTRASVSSQSEHCPYLASTYQAANPLKHSVCSWLDPLSSLSSMERALLHHLVHNVSHATSCHSLIQQDVCQMITPMALVNPGLLSATMALSGIHRKSLTLEGLVSYDPDKLIADLKATSLRRLLRDLDDATNGKANCLVATVRTLYLCEFYAGGDRPGTWRAHFEGARALMVALKSSKNLAPADQDSSGRCLRRWLRVTEDMVALRADCPSQGTFANFATVDSSTVGMSTESVYLDEYTGCSTDLSVLFRKIGAAAQKRQRANGIARNCEGLRENDIVRQAVLLEKSLNGMMERDNSQPPKFHLRVASLLSAQQAREFYLCSEAYQYAALIHITFRMRGLPATSPTVQSSVKKILQCIISIRFASPSPLAVLATPLFTAGCEVLRADRDLVRQLLKNIFELMQIPNMVRCLEVLKEYWASAQCKQDDGWECFMRMALACCSSICSIHY
jgi:Fungal specific transcription factor domain